MNISVYEQAFFGSFANDDARPPRPSVIDQAINAIRKENFRSEPRGYYIWADGRWNGPLKLEGLMRAANERLKARGKPQITVNAAWRV